MADDLLTDRNWRWARQRWQLVDAERTGFARTFSAANLNLHFALRDLAREMRRSFRFLGKTGARMLLWLVWIGVAVALSNIAGGLAR